eukprot:GHRQ01002783.1.p1 GENE.GHRQ01002783.1~~GHRQ01002783.1.p1  ORF type:complete len:270 (+),score=108.58 GHRQ01002783.1:180-989(+)
MAAAMTRLRAFPSATEHCVAGCPVRVAPHIQRPAVACSSINSNSLTCPSIHHSTKWINKRQVACNYSGSRDLPRVAFFGRQEDPDLTVAKLQVGVFGQVEKFQRELDRIASVLDSDDEEAMGELVHDVVVFLSRNLEYCSYGQTALFMTDDFDELEQKYNQASISERSKFKAETLSNVGGRMLTSALRESGSDVGLDKWLCITLIMAAEATVKLPKIRSLEDLRQSLSLLGSLPPDAIVAVELLWTPQEPGDSYSKDELLHDYPKMAHL